MSYDMWWVLEHIGTICVLADYAIRLVRFLRAR